MLIRIPISAVILLRMHYNSDNNIIPHIIVLIFAQKIYQEIAGSDRSGVSRCRVPGEDKEKSLKNRHKGSFDPSCLFFNYCDISFFSHLPQSLHPLQISFIAHSLQLSR